MARTATSRTAAGTEAEPAGSRSGRFRYCLNTSTIRGQELGIVAEIDIAAKAGYDAIEPWLDTLHRYVQQGKSLDDLRKRLADAGLVVASAIGFAPWIVDDDEARRAGLEQARRDMDVIARIGGTRIAAPPAGAQDAPRVDLAVAAERYRALLELGDQAGVVPQAEVWGFSANLKRLSETAYVAIESRHPRACVLTDVYHLYKGGSDHASLRLLSNRAHFVMHFNDYPADPPRESISDAHRIYPGDGIAPLKSILSDLASCGFDGWLSLELFNRELWKQDPLTVAKTGLEKMRTAVAH
jgi:sugar phosphate isomerase/epimerase